MNFIGPRVMDKQEYEFCSNNFSKYYKLLLMKRLQTKGGIFGLSQLLGLGVHQKMNNIKIRQKKIFYDCYYIKHQNIRFDMLIVLMTPLIFFQLSNKRAVRVIRLVKTICKKNT